MRYPSDNFYRGYSLSFDLDRSGKQEFEIASTRLRKLGITPNPQLTQLSLVTIRDIHNFVSKYGKTEQKAILEYYKKKKITGNVIPIDITLAYESFQQLINAVSPFVEASQAGLLIYQFVKKIKNVIRRQKTTDEVEKQTKKVLTKVIKNDHNNRIIKNVINITIKNNNTKTKSRKIKKITRKDSTRKRAKLK